MEKFSLSDFWRDHWRGISWGVLVIFLGEIVFGIVTSIVIFGEFSYNHTHPAISLFHIIYLILRPFPYLLLVGAGFLAAKKSTKEFIAAGVATGVMWCILIDVVLTTGIWVSIHFQFPDHPSVIDANMQMIAQSRWNNLGQELLLGLLKTSLFTGIGGFIYKSQLKSVK